MYLKKTKKAPFADVLRNRCFAILSVKHVCWSLFFSYQKETPTQALSCECCEFLRTDFFVEHLRWLPLKGCIMDFFTGKFPDSGKFHQELDLEYIKQRRWWDVYVCFMVLLNVQYIMSNKLRKNSFRHSDWTYFLAEQNYTGFTKISMNRIWLWNIRGVKQQNFTTYKTNIVIKTDSIQIDVKRKCM